MKVKVKLNTRNIKLTKDIMKDVLKETADAINNDLKRSGTMPFDTGELQSVSTYVDDRKVTSGKVSIVSDSPKARRLYFHPEYKFKKDKNSKAGGLWFEPYISGIKKNYATKIFAALARSKMK